MLQIKEELNKAEFIIDVFKKELQIKDPFINPTVRTRDLVDMRALLMYLLRRHTHLSMERIGKFWSDENYIGKNHASVLHGIRKAENLLDSKFGDKLFMYRFAMCDRKIKEIMPAMVFEKKTVAEELIYTKELNRRLIHREIYRKDQINNFIKSLRYIPDIHKRNIENKIREWLIHS